MTSTVLYSYNGDILDLIGWFSIFNAYGRRISREFPMFFYIFFTTRIKPQRTAPKVYMEKLQKLLVHAAKHGPLEPAEWNFWMGSFSTTESFAANNWGRYIYTYYILYIYYVIMYYICMCIYIYIYMIIYIIHTYVPTHLPTYVRKSDVYIYILHIHIQIT